jgi:hypothetical protein
MTHEEVLERIVKLSVTPETNVVPSELATALMAVVELHKPESRRMPFCVECRAVWQGEIDVVLYPCPTIKAIEKVLT